MAARSQARLVLWDLDHTLIESRGLGRAIYERIFPEVTGQPLRTLATVHGRTELDIIHETLRLHNIEPTKQIVDQVAAALSKGYRAAVHELATRGRVMPGAREALNALMAEPQLYQSVLTGNTTDVARIKIEAFKLDRYLNLSFGAYGDDHHDRAELVSIARKRAAEVLGTTISVEQVILVGDTPSDVNAALIAGAHIIAIATGKYSVDDLLAAGAKTCLVSLVDLVQLQQALLG